MKIALYVLKQKVPPSASWSASCRALQLKSITSEGLVSELLGKAVLCAAYSFR